MKRHAPLRTGLRSSEGGSSAPGPPRLFLYAPTPLATVATRQGGYPGSGGAVVPTGGVTVSIPVAMK